MANLSLLRRRRYNRGFSIRQAGNIGRRKYTGDGNRAFLTTSLSGANNDLRFMSERIGTVGNSVTVAYVVSGNNTPLSVSVATNAITVNVATNGSAAATSTATDVARAVSFHRQAGALVSVWNAPGNDGTGVVAAMGATALSGATATPAV